VGERPITAVPSEPLRIKGKSTVHFLSATGIPAWEEAVVKVCTIVCMWNIFTI